MASIFSASQSSKKGKEEKWQHFLVLLSVIDFELPAI